MSNLDVNKANDELKKLAESEGVSMNESFKLDKESLDAVAGGYTEMWDSYGSYGRSRLASNGRYFDTYGANGALR